ncbi:hypothetical protein [Streptomyces sp. BF23-19]|uniref:hypothetical protein n=1 Tax=unclassified Streptomyces TaxID=2593676 RepID=UPI0034E406E5
MPPCRTARPARPRPVREGNGLRFEGGLDGTPVATVEVFGPATNTWAKLPPLQVARQAHGGAAAPCPGDLKVHGTCVYAISGTGVASSPLGGGVRPCPGQWQYAADTPPPADFGTAAASCPEDMSNGCVYTVGGTTAAVDPLSGTPSRPTPRPRTPG